MKKLTIFLVLVFITGMIYVPTSAFAVQATGATTVTRTQESYTVESAHNYVNNYDYTWTITKSGASQIRVYFQYLRTESSYDYVYVYDGAGNLLNSYTGAHDNTWSSYSSSDTIKVRLKTDYSVTDWGFRITYIDYDVAGGDTTAPSVSVTAPANGATVSGTTTVSCSASDANGISSYAIKIDGATKSTSSSYSWDTTAYSNAAHTVVCEATDPSGNTGSDSVSVTVDNSAVSNVLTDGTPSTGSFSAAGDSFVWQIAVGADAASMRVVLDSGSSDYDFFASHLTTTPSHTNNEFEGYTSGGEDVTFNNPAAATWYITANDYSGSGSYTITVTITYNTGSSNELTSGTPVTSSLASGADETWTIAVDADATSMHVVLDCGSSDFDFFASHLTATPTHSSNEFEGYTSGGEDVTFNNPAAGTWYINVDVYSGSGSYTLTVTVTYGSSSSDWGTGGKYAVIWGISDYANINDLSYCDEDATDVYNYLTGQGYEVKVFGDSHSSNYPVWNGLATESNVRGMIQSLAAHAQVGDDVVIWASSHGGATGTYAGGYQSSGSSYTGDDPGTGFSYTLMYNYASSPTTEINSNDESYSAGEIRADLESFTDGVHIFVGIDACQSGGIPWELSQSSEYQYWYIAVTAGVNGYGYDESSHQNGAFTYWYIEQGVVAQGNNNAHNAFVYADSQYNPSNAADNFREYQGYNYNF